MEAENTADILRSVSGSMGFPWPHRDDKAAWVRTVLDRVPSEHQLRAAALLDLAHEFARQRRIASVTVTLGLVKTLQS